MSGDRLERLAAVVAMPLERFARQRRLPLFVAMQAQIRAAERLLPYIGRDAHG